MIRQSCSSVQSEFTQNVNLVHFLVMSAFQKLFNFEPRRFNIFLFIFETA
jgi:hypothetical protein